LPGGQFRQPQSLALDGLADICDRLEFSRQRRRKGCILSDQENPRYAIRSAYPLFDFAAPHRQGFWIGAEVESQPVLQFP